MRQSQKLGGICISAAIALLGTQPALGAATSVTSVQLNQTQSQLDLILKTQAGKSEGKEKQLRPQVIMASRDNDLVADIVNTQLQLPEGESFRQTNPMPGITEVVATQLNDNVIRVVVSGAENYPKGEIIEAGDDKITLNFSPTSSTSAAESSQTSSTELSQELSLSSSTGIDAVESADNPFLAETLLAQTPQIPTVPAPTLTPGVTVPVPNTQIPPGGVTVQPAAPAPAFLPRAVPPPTGDMSVSNIDASGAIIDLETNVRIPRLVLKDAPAREVLELLARAAGLNLAFITGTAATPATPGQATATTGQATATTGGPPISLNIEDEPVQNVFNYVLQLTGLQANRVGRTIFVGTQLPQNARNIISRSFRLNQIAVGQAVGFLLAQGAEQQQVTTVTTSLAVVDPTVPISGDQRSAETNLFLDRVQNTATTITRVTGEPGATTVTPAAPLVLRGLLVTPNERLNSITLVGEPRQVELASAYLTQLDLRRRQVAINVKIVDVNLLNLNTFGTSLSFGLGNTSFAFDQGAATFNFGGAAGAQPSQFLAALQAQISTGSGKILADPTLVVQEGQRSTVNLAQEVFGGFETGFQQVGTVVQPTRRPIIRQAGLILNILVNRIDDNGFITLAVNPTISAPSGSVPTPEGPISLLQNRELQSGQIRLRDSQTLILSGIIQESDQTTVSKVPILGDIPLLGALFRRTERNQQRSEVVVLVTPRIIDDSSNADFGYNYNPSPGVREVLPAQVVPTPGATTR